MTIETERIYEISREQFYGVFQNAYPYTAVIRGNNQVKYHALLRL